MNVKHTPSRRVAYMRARVERAKFVSYAFDCIDAARTARKAGQHSAADFYAFCAAAHRRHAVAAIAKTNGSPA